MSPENVLKEIEERSRKEFLPLIGRQKGSVLETIIKNYKPSLVLEVGTLVGYSAILMARLLKGGKIITIEKNTDAARTAKENIWKAGLGNVEVFEGDAKDIIPLLPGPFDIVFLDAAKGEYLAYLLLAEGKLNPGAWVVADNAKLFAQDMKEYLEYVRSSGKYRSTFKDFGFDGVEVSQKI